MRRWHSTARVALVARGALLVLSASLAAAQGSLPGDLVWVVALLLIGLAAATVRSGQVTTLLLLATESTVCGVAVVLTGSETSAFLPYLLAPALAGGLSHGIVGAVVPPGAAAVGLLLTRAVTTQTSPVTSFSEAAAQWVVLSGLVGMVTAWARRLAEDPGQQTPEMAQRAAYELLSQLRIVARRLPGSLDPTATAEALLAAAADVVPHEAGAVLVRSSGSRLTPLTPGASHHDWDLSLGGDNTMADAWATQQPQPRDSRLRRVDGRWPSGSSLVVPLTLGLRTFGLLVVESGASKAWSTTDIVAVRQRVERYVLQLETSLLFDEVRSLATADERQRVAREIHDGIAQELVFLGYALDNAAVEAGGVDSTLEQQLLSLRGEVTRLVSELRLSLFDLRSNVDPMAGLGTALSEHVRSVSATTGLTVHLRLDESALRLPASAEVELFRIAQEAVANARKHANARNLWINCEVDPPNACIVVEDDGIGLPADRASTSYGMGIMRERADRVGAVLDVGPRQPRGTRVEVRLGTVMARSSGARSPE